MDWGTASEAAQTELIVDIGGQIGDTIEGLGKFLKNTRMMVYLVMMAIRIVEMKRILKDTGTLYLHCDTHAGHYLKIILDAIFGRSQKRFRNEIIWCYSGGGVPKKDFARKHDTIFRYSKGDNIVFNVDTVRTSYSEGSQNRMKTSATKAFRGEKIYDNYSMNQLGKHPDDWLEIPKKIRKAEKSDYNTQKPFELYQRFIKASSKVGDFVLDPFAGCGTTVIAAEQLGRQWLGIDLTYLTIGATKLQIEKLCPNIRGQIKIIGTPENEDQALQLAQSDPQGFEDWCIAHVLKFKRTAKTPGDGGIDGTLKFPIGSVKGKQAYGKGVAQIKGGNHTLGHIRDFRTAMQNENADFGIFVTTTTPTSGIEQEIARAGIYEHPSYILDIPVLQYYQIQDYFQNKLPKIPHAERKIL